jgi:hypothetical protein
MGEVQGKDIEFGTCTQLGEEGGSKRSLQMGTLGEGT